MENYQNTNQEAANVTAGNCFIVPEELRGHNTLWRPVSSGHPEELGNDACGIGTVVNIDGTKDGKVLDDALHIVEKLEHRAGKDATGKVGDGVGILLQISHDFFKKAAQEAGIVLREERDYGVGMFFFPENEKKRTFAKRMFEVIAKKNGLTVLGWRPVPSHPEILGKIALDCMPCIEQCFIERPGGVERGIDFDRRLYVQRREFEQSSEDTYICSLSSRTIVYKGMFLVGQLRAFYDDLRDPDYKTAIAIVHSRFSTNTTPSWDRAHPYRMLAHNGEINTIKGNIDRMLAREETMQSPFLDKEVEKIFPVVERNGSDSSMLDNTLEFMYMNGMELPLAMTVTIPEPWKHNRFMDHEKRDFYHYYATMMEPWDGPAAIIFSDGDVVGATLDRNGLRPSRYYITDDNRLILASEVGVLDIDSKHIVDKSRLQPGRMLLVDTRQKRIVSDSEIKKHYAEKNPYGEWLDRNLLHLEDIRIPNHKVETHDREQRDKLYKAFGYTHEDVKSIILPMAQNGVEDTASMGHDTPLAVLDNKHQLLFRYFKQLFAQVTNPPIDSLREKVVTDTTVYLGSDGNLLQEKAENCRVLEITNPILTGVELLKIKELSAPGFKSAVVSLLYYQNTSLERALQQLNITVDRAYQRGCNIIILSDRGVDENHVAIPSLLAVSSVEQHLVLTKKRTAVSLILESAEPRDVHQFAAILGFGARAINPYLAHECIAEIIDEGYLDKDTHTAIEDYNKAVLHGIVKISAKMGISTIQSYQSAKIFEAIGLSREFTDKYFTGTVSRVGGIGIKEISEGVNWRHELAFDPLGLNGADGDESMFYSVPALKNRKISLEASGEENEKLQKLRMANFCNVKDKDEHLYTPKTIKALQQAVQKGDYKRFKEYSAMIDDAPIPHALRGIMEFAPKNKPVPLSEVEPVESIVKRFKTGAMSYGSISLEAHETMAVAMNRLGGKSNSGEGGEDPSRYGTERNSAIKQVASGRFGVTGSYLNSASEIQIKMAQGAKPGEGGHLPGKKVYPWIAKTRFSTPGVSLISPPPHHDIYSIEDLAQLIYDLKNANRRARISVKLVSENGVGTIACGVAKAGAQVILISGYDGGTGAAPMTSIHHAGLPWELGITEAHQTLIRNGLRNRVMLETDGKLMTGRDVAIAALLGAEEYGFATTALVSMGCMMMRVCHKDTCPFGVATQNDRLRAKFRGKPEYVMNFMRFIAEELREIMAELGFRTVQEMVGRTDCLTFSEERANVTDRAKKVDLSAILDPEFASLPENVRHFDPEHVYDFHLEKTLDEDVLLPKFKGALEKGEHHEEKVKVSSTNRTFGTILGSEITDNYWMGTKTQELQDDTFVVEAYGGGGQSFGAFIPKGLTIRLHGDANDGFGKGLSGGKLIVTPPKGRAFRPSENIIIGNVALYGATSGKCYVEGIAGERFCVRNSGATAVAEGCGDHGLEYMTGGRAVILGHTGKNFAAGMSGGIAYVLDEDHSLYLKLNKDMVQLREVTERYDVKELKAILKDYVQETGSELGKDILENFDRFLPSFKKIVPNDYQKVQDAVNHFEDSGSSPQDAEMEAFKLLFS
ncbi:glutamate synthase-related protein [Oribacterium sp. NK2B42]|uniref:glutamate synthase-related protein n=1 Tax=Oribacterium sp. NK2B42 TaxID=689781 RepID=UPI00041F335E|nr:glutamate synthase-related protein [Oribacterium sp. NK2B42]